MELAILFAGFGGGVIRGLVGFLKHQFSYKDVKFHLPYFLFMTGLSGFIGLAVAIVIKETKSISFGIEGITPALALIIGYAGGDFLEGIWKIVIKKP